MLYPKLTNSPQCEEIPNLLANIDCALNQLSIDLYNNTVYMLNRSVSYINMISLLHYRRILTAKYCNSDYALPITVEMIASKVKRLTLGCKSKCISNTHPNLITTTTSTSTSTSTTTSTTTVAPTTTTTTTI